MANINIDVEHFRDTLRFARETEQEANFCIKWAQMMSLVGDYAARIEGVEVSIMRDYISHSFVAGVTTDTPTKMLIFNCGLVWHRDDGKWLVHT